MPIEDGRRKPFINNFPPKAKMVHINGNIPKSTILEISVIFLDPSMKRELTYIRAKNIMINPSHKKIMVSSDGNYSETKYSCQYYQYPGSQENLFWFHMKLLNKIGTREKGSL